jgi:hypothetical protein
VKTRIVFLAIALGAVILALVAADGVWPGVS